MKYLFSLLIISSSFFATSQIVIGGANPADFISTALSSNNVSISNVNYIGYSGAICYFSANILNMPFTSGLLMTIGRNSSVKGPNNASNTSFSNYTVGYGPLTSITGGGSTYDASIISFDVIPNGDTLKIRYIFGSEEYPEYVNSQFCDAFAIFISGPGISGTQNIARLSNGFPVTVNNVNPSTNPSSFVNNGNGSQAPYYSSDAYLQFDGLTVPLTAKSAVIPNQTYHIEIAIADGGDDTYDSGAFIEEGGITASVGENNLDNFVNVIYSPIDQQAKIKISEYQDHLSYSIVDLTGKIMSQSKITETTSIDLSDYSSGMYLIRVEGSNGQISKKVIR
jgi:hypothetical protein